MGTKNQPGKFDCYANAEPDEPMFVLLGRDPCAWVAVHVWLKLRRVAGYDEPEVAKEAVECAKKMADWARTAGKGAAVEQMVDQFSELLKPVIEAAKLAESE